MLKKFFIIASCLIGLFISISAYSLPISIISLFVSAKSTKCGLSAPAYAANFCPSFQAIAMCNCKEKSPLPSVQCRDMNSIYQYMVSYFGGQDKACQYQKDEPYQTCMDKWNCYRLGGKDSSNHFCSGNPQGAPYNKCA